MRAAILLVVAACGGAAPAPERDDPAAAPDLGRHRARYQIRWNGIPAGSAEERLEPAGRGFRFRRRESWQVARGGALVGGGLDLTIDTDADLDPVAVAVAGSGLVGRARRQGDRWLIEVAGEPARRADGVPFELLPLLMARRGLDRFAGPVLLVGLGFAPAHAVVEPDGDRRRRVELSGPAGRLAIRVALRADGTVERAVGPDLSVHRIDRGAAPGARPDLVALGMLEVAGEPARAILLELAGGAHLQLAADRPIAACEAGCAPAVPDPPPAPVLRPLADRLAAGGGPPRAEVMRLARATAAFLADDLAAAGGADPVRIAAVRRADCVGHAALFSALARARGHTVRLVTGYRLEGRRLVRHAWAIAWPRGGGAAIALDPTSGEPAGGGHFPLAVHGSAAAELALAAELAYAGHSGARARFTAPRSARSTPRTP